MWNARHKKHLPWGRGRKCSRCCPQSSHLFPSLCYLETQCGASRHSWQFPLQAMCDPRETNIIQKHKPIMLPLAGVFPWTRGQASKTLGWTAMRSAGDLGDRRDQAVGAAATWLQLMVPCVVSASDFHSWIWILMLEMWIFVNLLILMLATESHCKKYCGGQIWELVWPVDLVYAQSKH